MRHTIIGLALILAVGGSRPVGAGQISGKIRILKPLSKESVTFSPYQSRGAFVTVQGSKEGEKEELSRLVVYLEGEGLPPGTPVKAQISQEKRQFAPEIVAVTVGSTVAFPNEDPILHNVFSLSKIKQFDLGYYPVGRSRSVTFEKPGIVEVYCHLHRDMSAAVVVTPSACYTQPDKEGRFSLSDVPGGSYRVVVYHKSAGFFRRPIEVPAEGQVEILMEVPVPDSKTGGKSQ